MAVLVFGTGAVWLEPAPTAPELPSSRPPPTAPPTSGPVAATNVPLTRPVDVPSDPYAPEPLVEIGTIEIPKLGLNHRVFHGITLRSIDKGPSHWPGSALPGERGNAVFAGHRVTHSRPFRNLDQLVPGDHVFFTIGAIRSSYVVIGHEIVSPSGMHIVEPTPTPTATLFACHPPGSARSRYVVHLALVASPA